MIRYLTLPTPYRLTGYWGVEHEDYPHPCVPSKISGLVSKVIAVEWRIGVIPFYDIIQNVRWACRLYFFLLFLSKSAHP